MSAATEKMRRGGAARDRDRHLRALRGAPAQRRAGPAARGGDRAAHGGPERGRAARGRCLRRSSRVVVLKLNGGLGTSMGMTRAKSLLEVKEGHTFLDVIVRQVLHLRGRARRGDPAAADEQLRDARRHARGARALPRAGASRGCRSTSCRARCRSCWPTASSRSTWHADPALEWAPPGHGDVFTSLATSGMLATLLERGYEYLFLSNSDNLGAVLDPRILGWFAREGLPFVSEVVDRTESDRKGGHLARRRDDGGLVLRETAQVPDEDQDGVRGRRAPPLLQLQQHLGQPARARADARGARRRARAADDREPQDRRPDRPVLARGRPARDGDGRGDRRVRGRGRACTCRARASRRSRPRAICSWCARTRTSWRTTGRSSSRRSATRRRWSS